LESGPCSIQVVDHNLKFLSRPSVNEHQDIKYSLRESRDKKVVKGRKSHIYPSFYFNSSTPYLSTNLPFFLSLEMLTLWKNFGTLQMLILEAEGGGGE
jgi:hypothetical protein